MAEKVFYSMGEVAEMLDVSHSLIRYWEKNFDILRPTKNKKGNRMFSPNDVRNLKTIYHLVKERGMTLSGAQKYMKASRNQIERDMELTERLATIRSLLVEVRDALGTDDTIADEPFAEEPADMPNDPERPAEAEPAEEESSYPEADEDEPEDMPDFEPEFNFGEEEDEDEPEKENSTEPTTKTSKPDSYDQSLF
jgi:DNA-binding transcriptional MerR regulator